MVRQCSRCGYQEQQYVQFCSQCGGQIIEIADDRTVEVSAGDYAAGNYSAGEQGMQYGYGETGNMPNYDPNIQVQPGQMMGVDSMPQYENTGYYGYSGQPAAPAKKSGKGLWIGLIMAVVLLGVVLTAVLFLLKSGSETNEAVISSIGVKEEQSSEKTETKQKKNADKKAADKKVSDKKEKNKKESKDQQGSDQEESKPKQTSKETSEGSDTKTETGKFKKTKSVKTFEKKTSDQDKKKQETQKDQEQVIQQPETVEPEKVPEVSEYILPESNQRYLQKSDLAGLSAEECRIARNEIYARHGRRFADQGLQAYFNEKSWYMGTIEPNDFNENVFNQYEVANKDLIIQFEKEQGYR
ncbi:YARHG domain-containing protein [Clostridiales bacterium COT073_COT-073]|nr:YARHG domain-containing protein [Clostridiales bacterium COT073_COT-073]